MLAQSVKVFFYFCVIVLATTARGGVGSAEMGAYLVDKTNPDTWAPFSRSWSDMMKIANYLDLNELRRGQP